MRFLIGGLLLVTFTFMAALHFPKISFTAGASTVYVGIISNPSNTKSRDSIRKFWARARLDKAMFRYNFVIGNGYSDNAPSADVARAVEAERKYHGDFLVVDAREQIPNPGKASEKSAAWWRKAPYTEYADFYCKTDDDAMIHPARLQRVFDTIQRDVHNPNVMLSYVRWRGWHPHDKFQACGGGWGGPTDALKDLRIGGKCASAEGPFPQGTGLLTCLSRPLAVALAEDEDFAHFSHVAHSRNTFGSPCATVAECAAQTSAQHMWHHEDAGISYNIWRMATRLKMPIHIVHLPERGWFFPWLATLNQLKRRTLLVHKFGTHDFEKLVDAWRPELPSVPMQVDCSQACDHWGWTRARIDCDIWLPKTSIVWRNRDNGSLCEIIPKSTYRCCFLDADRRF